MKIIPDKTVMLKKKKKTPPSYHMIFKARIFLFTSKESKENVHGSLKKIQWGNGAGNNNWLKAHLDLYSHHTKKKKNYGLL